MDFLKLKQFSPSHVAIILFALVFTATFYFVIFRRKKAKTKTIITLVFGVLALLSVIGTSLYYTLTVGNLKVFEYLPLQLSQISILLILVACACKSTKFKSITFFIASLSAVYGLVVLENSVLAIETVSITTALYFLPYFFLFVASFMLLSNIKVKTANIISAYSLLVVLTAFAHTANLALMQFVSNTGILNYFYTIAPRDIVMESLAELLPYQFVYLMPVTLIYFILSFITLAFAKLTKPKQAPLHASLPKWEFDESAKDTDETEQSTENNLHKKENAPLSEKLKEEEIDSTEEEKNKEQRAKDTTVKDTDNSDANKEEEEELDELNSYLDSILPPLPEDTKSEQDAEKPDLKDTLTTDSTEAQTKPLEKEITPLSEKADEKPVEVQPKEQAQEQKEEKPQQSTEEKPEAKEETTFDINDILPRGEPSKQEEKVTTQSNTQTPINQAEEPVKEPETHSTATLPQAKKQSAKPEKQEQDDYDKYTSFEDYDFMKELEEFKKMLNETDSKLFNQTKQDAGTSTTASLAKPDKKASNLDLLKALKNKVDKNKD